MNFGIIIPSDCPDEKLVKLAKELVQREETMIVVIDDGCGEDIVYTRIYQMIEEIGGTVLHHKNKLGRGTAIKTGMRYAMKPVSYTHLSGRTGKCSQRTDLRPPGIHPRLDRIYKLLQK